MLVDELAEVGAELAERVGEGAGEGAAATLSSGGLSFSGLMTRHHSFGRVTMSAFVLPMISNSSPCSFAGTLNPSRTMMKSSTI